MTQIKLQARVYEKKKGMSTEIVADGVVADGVRLSLKVAVDGTLTPERENAFQSLLTRYALNLLADNEFKESS